MTLVDLDPNLGDLGRKRVDQDAFERSRWCLGFRMWFCVYFTLDTPCKVVVRWLCSLCFWCYVLD
jgi:hypothetical protein